MRRLSVLPLLVLLFSGSLPAQPTPTRLEELDYDVAFFPGTVYDSAIPTVEDLLGFRPGDRAAFPAEIETCLRAWDAASDRTRLVEYARSHEDRGLYYMAVSSPENIARLDEIRAGLGRLADPRELAAEDAERLVASLPVTAWLAYSIHGDETSGADGALAVLHHLIAGQSEDVTALLDEVVVLVDPMMNPDGRQRFLQQIAEHRATTPNVDDQSLLHTGYWPWGRGNHYLFDLNRDWLAAINPESRGRIREAGSWHPLLFVDAHEMGALDTYLFSPARDPRHPYIPARRQHWNAVFARDQAAAFDRYNWVYYTGEWNEGWYPGYSDAWAEYRGAVGILYEQSGYAEDGVRQASGALPTYREAVHHQAVSSLANLGSLRANGREMLAEFAAERQRAVAPDGPWAERTFAILPTGNRTRLEAFLDLLELHGIEVHQAPERIRGASGFDQLGRRFARRDLPAGTLLVANRQPEAHLTATFLEFDTRMTDAYVERERETILRDGRSSIYDLTAWNLTMLFGLDAVTLDGDLPAGAERFTGGRTDAPAPARAPMESGPIVAWVVEGADDASVAGAARLMEQGARVRVADRAFEFGGAQFGRGTLVVLPADNGAFDGDLGAAVLSTVTASGLAVETVTTGLGEGDLPDIGGGHFTLLERPRIALVGRAGYSSTDYGSIWHTIDHRLGIRHSQVQGEALDFTDLRRYNVLVLPDQWYGTLDDSAKAGLADWVESGGTLIAIGGSARVLAGSDSKLSRVRRLEDVLENLDEYELQVLREWMASRSETPASDAVWSHTVASDASFPWSGLDDTARPGAQDLQRRDAWQRQFMPQGAFLAGRVDPRHWLTFGVGETLPVLFGSRNVLMAAGGIETPIRLGVFTPSADTPARRAGWGPVPQGHDLRLRLSGLLWPEAAQRLANAPWVTRERRGSGQVVLFASPPTFRAATLGTMRIFLNALVYGPGFGARHPIEP